MTETIFALKMAQTEKVVTEKVTAKVTENQKRILEEVRKNKSVTTNELSVIIGISVRKIKENIKKLKDKDLLGRVGPDKGGHWEIPE